MDAEIKEKIYACKKCGARFSRRASLFHHQASVHFRQEQVSCRVCGKKLDTGVALANHLRAHNHSAVLVAAQQCKKKLLNIQKRKWKANLLKKQVCENLKCSVCWKKFMYRGSWLKHIKTHSDANINSEENLPAALVASQEKKYSCSVCHREFEGSKIRFNHMRWHQKHAHYLSKGVYAIKRGVDYWCAMCGLKFSSNSAVFGHIKVHKKKVLHSSTECRSFRGFECKSCGLKLLSKQRLESHIKIHVKASQRYKCHFCKKKCASSEALSAHVKIHATGNSEVLVQTSSKLEVSATADLSKCLLCGMKYKSTSGLLLHSRRHRAENGTFQCLECELTFSSKRGLKIHSHWHRKGQEICKCETCGMEFKSRVGMLVHSKLVHKASQYNFKIHKTSQNNLQINKNICCDLCGVECRSSHGLLLHSRRHTAKRGCFKCLKCSLKFKTKLGLKIHSHWHNRRPEQSKCNTCGLEFKSKVGLVLHSRVHKMVQKNAKESPRYGCRVCDMICKSSRGLARHMLWHRKKEENIKCETCGLECKSSRGLLRHSRKHIVAVSSAQAREKNNGSSSTQQEAYKCAECLTIVGSKMGFNGHVKSHAGLRRYQCRECGISFKQKCHLEHHSEVHGKELKHKCYLCTASYHMKRNLLDHLNMHEQPDFSSPICKHCKFHFSSDASLLRHVKAHHSGKQKFECNICHGQYRKIVYLKQHLAIHNRQLESVVPVSKNKTNLPLLVNVIKPSSQFVKKQKINVCELCGKNFGYYSSLKYHMQNTHHHIRCDVCHAFVDVQHGKVTAGAHHKYICFTCNPTNVKNCNTSSYLKLESIPQLVVALLYKLVDREILKAEGLLSKHIDVQLEAIVRLCGQNPIRSEMYSSEECMLENVKLLFALSVGEAAASTLLQFKSVEDILYTILNPVPKT